MKKTLKELKKELEEYESEGDYSKSLTLCNDIIKIFPKNSYGYIKKIKISTMYFKKYLSEVELKALKDVYNKATNLISKKEKKKFKEEYERYIDDCNEVENYKKIKNKVITKKLIKEISNNKINIIDNKIKLLENTNIKKHKINTFMHGLFLILCLIYNIMNPNYLLFLTIPFGVFGIISVLTYITSILDEKRFKNKINDKENLIKNKNKLTEDVKKCDLDISFNEDIINETLSKIPSCFIEDVLSMFEDDNKIINNIILSMKDSDVVTLNYLIDKYTELEDKEINYYLSLLNEEDEEFFKYINKNNNYKNSINMKKIKLYNYILLCLFIVLSVFSLIILYNNFYEINNIAFLFSTLIGIITLIIYDISEKSQSLTDAVNDTLLNTIFNSTLAYNLIYISITNELNISYGFIEIPIIFLLIFVGPIYLVSLFKYSILFKNKHINK